jgi:hypothetical protein
MYLLLGRGRLVGPSHLGNHRARKNRWSGDRPGEPAKRLGQHLRRQFPGANCGHPHSMSSAGRPTAKSKATGRSSIIRYSIHRSLDWMRDHCHSWQGVRGATYRRPDRLTAAVECLSFCSASLVSIEIRKIFQTLGDRGVIGSDRLL